MPTTTNQDPRTERVARMVTLRLQGATLQDVADEYGLSRQRVQQLTAPYVDPAEARDAHHAAVERLVSMFRDELTEAALSGADPAATARLIGLPVGRVRAVMAAARQGMPMDARRAAWRQRTGAPRWTDADITDALTRAADLLGCTPGVKSYDGLRASGSLTGPSGVLICVRVGWAEACRRAGLAPNDRPTSPAVGARGYSDEDFRVALSRVAGVLGYKPSMREYDELRHQDEPLAVTIRARCGTSWGVALSRFVG